MRNSAVHWVVLFALSGTYCAADVVISLPATPVIGNAVSMGALDPVRRIQMYPSAAIFTGVGQTQKIESTAYYSESQAVPLGSKQGLTYTSANPAIATVDAYGQITAIAVGSTTISAYLASTPGVISTATVEVNTNVFLSSVAIKQQTISFAFPGQSIPLHVSGGLSDGRVFDISRHSGLYYVTSDTTVATVTSDGTVFAQGNGHAVIGVKSYYAAATTLAVVNETISLTSVNLTVQSAVLRSTGAATHVSLSGTLSNGGVVNLTTQNTGTQYTVDSSTVVSVSSYGYVVALGNGLALITASNSGLTSSATVQVSVSNIQSLAISPGNTSISLNPNAVATPLQLAVVAQFSDGTFADRTSSSTGTSYQTSNPGVAAVGASGLISFLQAGSVTISATNSRITTSSTYSSFQFTPIALGQLILSQGAQGPNSVKVSGSLAYVTNPTGLLVVNVSSPMAPAALGYAALNGNASDLSVRNSLVYVANGSNLAIVDVSTPTTPVVEATLNTGGNVQAVAISSDTLKLYIGDSQGLKIASLTNPRSPAIVGTVALSGGMNQIAVAGLSGNLAFVSQGAQVSIMDVSVSTLPVFISSISMPSAGISASGNYAYVAGGISGVQVLNATNPAAPYISGATNLSIAATGTVYEGGTVLTVDEKILDSIEMFNVADPTNPTYSGIINFSTTNYIVGNRVDANATYVYRVGGGSGAPYLLQIGMYAPPNPPMPPTATVISPVPGSSAADGGIVQMAAQASDSVGVQRVDFLVNGVPQVSVYNPPYIANVQLPTGQIGQTITLGARAVNMAGVPSNLSTTTVNDILDPLTTAQGRIVSNLDIPLANVPITFESSVTVFSNADGTFNVPNLPTAPGIVTLTSTSTVSGVIVTAAVATPPVLGGVVSFGDVYLTAQSTLSGNISGILTLAASPYSVISNVTVPSSSTLTMQPGTVVKLASGTSFMVQGTLSALGVSTNPVVFTSLADNSLMGDTGGNPASTGAPGQWGQLTFQNASPGSVIQNTIVRFGQQVTLQGSSPQFNSVTFSSMSLVAMSADIASSPSGANNSAYGCGLNGIDHPGGLVATSITWSPIGLSHMVRSGRIILQEGITTQGQLTLNPGVIVKLKSAGVQNVEADQAGILGNPQTQFTVAGTSAAPVVFTSLNDDSVGGSVFTGGSPTPPAAGDWNGIQVLGYGNISNAVVRYGGQQGIRASDTLGDATFANLPLLEIFASTAPVQNVDLGIGLSDGLSLKGAQSSITGVVVHGNQGNGIVFAPDPGNSSLPAVTTMTAVQSYGNSGLGFSGATDTAGLLTIANATFTANTAGAIQINPNLPFVFSDLHLFGNTGLNSIDVVGGGIVRSLQWQPGVTYTVRQGRIIIGNGSPGSLTLSPGVVVKLKTAAVVNVEADQAGFVVTNLGQLQAVGTALQPITFTSVLDDSIGGSVYTGGSPTPAAPGDWNGLQFAVGGPIPYPLSFVALHYGGQTGIRQTDSLGDIAFQNVPMLDIISSTMTVANVDVSSSVSDGIRLTPDSVVMVSSSVFHGNAVGIHATIPDIQNLLASSVNSSVIQGNVIGVQNDDTLVPLTVTSDYWGDPSGPTSSNNPGGIGDSVSGLVSFQPFLPGPPVGAGP